MAELELTSFFFKYDVEFFEIEYSDDHPDFVYTPRAPPVFILFSHQLLTKMIQEQPSEDLFETESDTELSSLEEVQI